MRTRLEQVNCGPLSLRERVRVRAGGQKTVIVCEGADNAVTPCPSPKGRGEPGGMKPRRRKRPDRAGYALVLFLMIFFGLMGLAALVIDMGFARLAQRQMQTAVDSAALEGLRWRDGLPAAIGTDPEFLALRPSFNPSAPTVGDMDCARRLMAGRMTANTFDDDLNPANGDPMNFGAGPVVQFQGGNATLPTASQQLIVPATPVYKPARSDGAPGLELNSGNAPGGDMGAGTYGSNPGYDPAQLADEDANYNRRDFTLAAGAPVPAFLVRMRRTPLGNVSGSLDNTPGVSSGGPPLPLLFGRGSLMAQSGSSGQLSVASGITARATAIAAAVDGIQFGAASYNAGRAKTAGQPYQYIDPTSGNHVSLPGVAPFAMTRAFWQSLAAGGSAQVAVTSAGVLTAAGQAIQSSGILQIGQQIGQSVSIANVSAIAAAVASPLYAPSNLYQYVPIYDTIAGANTIIGFGYLPQWTWQADPVNGGGTLTLTPPSGPQPVGYGNISGTFVPGLPQDTSDYSDLFAAHASFTGGSAYAPVLVDHYIGPQQFNP